jgi:hypothetical protein
MADQARFTSEISSDGKKVLLKLPGSVVYAVKPQCVGALSELAFAFQTCDWKEISTDVVIAFSANKSLGYVTLGVNPYMLRSGPDAIAFSINGETWNVTAGDNYRWIKQELLALVENIKVISGDGEYELSTVNTKRIQVREHLNCLSVYPRDAGVGCQLDIECGYKILEGFFDIASATGQAPELQGSYSQPVRGSGAIEFVGIRPDARHRQWCVNIVYHNGTNCSFIMTPTDIITLCYRISDLVGYVPDGKPTIEQIKTVLLKAYKEHPFDPKPVVKPEPVVKAETSSTTAQDSSFVSTLHLIIREIVRDELRKAFQPFLADAKP